jgi:putative ABC transport system substrate-binding protein
VFSADPIVSTWGDELLQRVSRHAIPAMFPYRHFVEAGGLASYGVNLSDVYRQVGIHVSRILKGESPSGLPVVQSTKFELVVNNGTAKALGLEVPLSLLMRIDSVID